MNPVPCMWIGCKSKDSNRAGLSLCQEHYLLKEASYAVYDLERPDDSWPNNGADKDFIQKFAVKRLLNLAKYHLKEKT